MLQHHIPVFVVTGFLGSGKTTLVNQLIANAGARRIGVIVNEFGDVGIDGSLIVSDTEEVVEITNGCICCTVRSDLVEAVHRLLAVTGESLDVIVVETSGLAEPAPVVQTFLATAELRERLELHAVITVVDVVNLEQHLNEPVASEQIALADWLLVNKSDLLECSRAANEQRASAQRLLRNLNGSARLSEHTHCAISLADLLDGPRFIRPNAPELDDTEPLSVDDPPHHVHTHDHSLQAHGVRISAPLDPILFNQWANRLVQAQGQRLLRMKGVVQLAGEPRQFIFHSVHMLLEMRPGQLWPAFEPRTTRIVFIGRAFDPVELEKGLLDCVESVPDALYQQQPISTGRASLLASPQS